MKKIFKYFKATVCCAISGLCFMLSFDPESTPVQCDNYPLFIVSAVFFCLALGSVLDE